MYCCFTRLVILGTCYGKLKNYMHFNEFEQTKTFFILDTAFEIRTFSKVTPGFVLVLRIAM